ncbi:MAG: GNAT family N-acetyltransferase [Pseudolysinimonas sp.]
MSTIRTALARDWPGIYRVCLQTGNSGKDATALFTDPDLLGHVYCGPFVEHDPGLAFVVVDEHGVGGYAMACADTSAFASWAEHNWWPSLRAQYANTPRIGRDGDVIDLLFDPPSAQASVLAAFPAQMHIDLTSRVRGQGTGRAMVQALIDALVARGVDGLHLDVSAENLNAIEFYRHLGFHELERQDSSVFMGMKLTSQQGQR